MQGITGTKVRYVVYQEKPEVREGTNVTVALTYNSYNGAFSEAFNFGDATLFEHEEEAIQLATLQNQISQILKQDFNYIVIKQVDTRTAVYSGKEIEEPEVTVEPEEPEAPEEPTEEPTE